MINKKKTNPRKNEKKRQAIPAKEREFEKVGNAKGKGLKGSQRSIVIDDFIEIRILDNAIPKTMDKGLWRILNVQDWFPMKQEKNVKSDSALILSLIRYGFTKEEITSIYTDYNYNIEKFKYTGAGHNRPAFVREIEELFKKAKRKNFQTEWENIFSNFRISDNANLLDQIIAVLLVKEYHWTLAGIPRVNYSKLSWESGYSNYRVGKAIKRFVDEEIIHIHSKPTNKGGNYDGCKFAFNADRIKSLKVKYFNVPVIYERARPVNLFSPEIYHEYFREIPKSIYAIYKIIKTHYFGIEAKDIITMAMFHGLSERVVYNALKDLKRDRIVTLSGKMYFLNKLKKENLDSLAQKLRRMKEKEKYKIGNIKISFPPDHS
ncbi:hypothetical protein [Leptospira sarikeiensis]|uniref:Uncharacterized protein n=1 Tax=Leptospira sarikeiensis TaxID=2484943 RepID=A0A4R9KDB4_9LEPT|nr:hypothetical protein [Leptospira sarikeiensis]TGL65963.1 hypothetical protein EHQ64_00110 [Leptospira sarikeiensis]